MNKTVFDILTATMRTISTICMASVVGASVYAGLQWVASGIMVLQFFGSFAVLTSLLMIFTFVQFVRSGWKNPNCE